MVACCGTTPLPQALSCSLRVMSQSVIHPAGNPIIHSAKAGLSRCCPSFPSGIVGAGAGLPVIASHLWTAGANFPQSVEWTRVPSGGLLRSHCAGLSFCLYSVVSGVGNKATATSNLFFGSFSDISLLVGARSPALGVGNRSGLLTICATVTECNDPSDCCDDFRLSVYWSLTVGVGNFGSMCPPSASTCQPSFRL